MGAKIEEGEDNLTISQSPLVGARVETYRDHRIAMALGVAGLAAEGQTTILGTDCTEKSYPGFWQAMASIGAGIRVVS